MAKVRNLESENGTLRLELEILSTTQVEAKIDLAKDLGET